MVSNPNMIFDHIGILIDRERWWSGHNTLVLKTNGHESGSRVRIPPSPIYPIQEISFVEQSRIPEQSFIPLFGRLDERLSKLSQKDSLNYAQTTLDRSTESKNRLGSCPVVVYYQTKRLLGRWFMLSFPKELRSFKNRSRRQLNSVNL